MQVGDPKKAVVLAVVAIMVLGVAAFQLFPKAESLALKETPAVSSSEIEPAEIKSLPRSLTANPFLRPTPAKSPEGGATESSGPSPGWFGLHSNHSEFTSKSRSLEPFDPGVGKLSNPTITLPNATVDPQPAKNAENSQQEVGSPQKLDVNLKAILRIDRRVAVLTIGNKDEVVERTVGMKVGNYTIVSLTDSSATLVREWAGTKVKYTLKIGEDRQP